jgi:hypothetical protein
MELIDITPEGSVVPVYVEKLTVQEQAARDADLAQIQEEQETRQAEQDAKKTDKISGINKLIALGLTEEEAKALVNSI